MNDELDFSKILQQAEQLTAELDTASDLPRVQRNLRQITEAGQLLVSQSLKDESMANAETKASIFLGSKGVDITKLAKHLEPVAAISSTLETPWELGAESEIDKYLRGERSNAIYALSSTTLQQQFAEYLETSDAEYEKWWKSEKDSILADLGGSFEPADFARSLVQQKTDSSIILGKSELTYSHELANYNKALIQNSPRPNLIERMDLAAKTSGDKYAQELWSTMSTLLTGLSLDSNLSALERRSNPKFNQAIIGRAKQYLEKTQFASLQGEVWKTFGKARAGSPAVLTLIKHYIEAKNISSLPELEVGPADCGPVWAIIYFCLRSGKVDEAVQYVRATVGNPDFAEVLEEYAKCESGNGIPKDMEAKIRVEYHKLQRSFNGDPFKRIVYCILGACDVENDHSEIANRLDDYIWLKLSQVREEESTNTRIKKDLLTYSDLQKLILETYGESHFDAFKQPFTYLQALIFTGQFEAGIEFLSRINGLRYHAVHMAIVMNEMNLLITSDPNSPPLTRVNNDPPGLRRLNYCSLITRHAKSFQAVNTKEALNYLYFLRNIKELDGTSLFSISVSALTVECREFSLLFGTMNADGCRTPGILETMGLDIGPIIEHCATDSENTGKFEDAVILYDLGGKHEMALKVLTHLISSKVSEKPLHDPGRQRIQKIAVTLAERYQNFPPNVNKSILTTFYLLVDFMTFFDEFYKQHFDNALMHIERLKVLPLDKNDIERCVNNFHSYSDEIRMNIPELILATMESLFSKYKKAKAERPPVQGGGGEEAAPADLQIMTDIRSKSKNLVTYCGLIPYYMHGEIYTKVMQIEVQMN